MRQSENKIGLFRKNCIKQIFCYNLKFTLWEKIPCFLQNITSIKNLHIKSNNAISSKKLLKNLHKHLKPHNNRVFFASVHFVNSILNVGSNYFKRAKSSCIHLKIPTLGEKETNRNAERNGWISEKNGDATPQKFKWYKFPYCCATNSRTRMETVPPIRLTAWFRTNCPPVKVLTGIQRKTTVLMNWKIHVIQLICFVKTLYILKFAIKVKYNYEVLKVYITSVWMIMFIVQLIFFLLIIILSNHVGKKSVVISKNINYFD